MKLSYDKKSKNPTYRIQKGVRNGKKTTTFNVYTIGKHDELLKICDDPLEYAKKFVVDYNEQAKNSKLEFSYVVNFDEKLTYTNSTCSRNEFVNIGYFYLKKIFSDLKLNDFFSNLKDEKKRKMKFNSDEINELLTYSRILDPKSKLSTCDSTDFYYGKNKIQYHDTLRFLDFMSGNFDEYLSHLYSATDNYTTLDTSVCYYDCTNYYFETEKEDDDYFDEVTGELIKGFKKYGVSKQHQPSPLVQMGLFMDGNGIPLTMCLNPGSTNEQLTVKDVESKLIKSMKDAKFIYCADAGLGSMDIRVFNSMKNRDFIVTQAIKKLPEDIQNSIFFDSGYKLLSIDKPATIHSMKTFDKHDEKHKHFYNDYLYKVIDYDKEIDLGLYEEKQLKNGKIKNIKSKGTLKQNVIVTFSRKMYEYQRNIRSNQIERAKKLLETSNPEDIKKGPNDVKRFINRISTTKNKDEKVIDTYLLNNELIKEEEKYDGYYAIVTSLLNEKPQVIIQKTKNRYKIEDCFRVLKTNFNARPVYLQGKDRIISHFMICYTALLIYRLLEHKLNNKGYHFTIENILNTLKSMNVINIKDSHYQSLYCSSKVCTALNETFNLDLDKKYYEPKKLNKFLKK